MLAVDNLNGFSLLGRLLRVDHVAKYRGTKKEDDVDSEEERQKRQQILPKHLRDVSYINRIYLFITASLL